MGKTWKDSKPDSKIGNGHKKVKTSKDKKFEKFKIGKTEYEE